MSVQTVEEVVSLSGTGTDAVMAAVRKLLSRGDVTLLKVSAGESVVRYERVATPDEIEHKQQLTYHDVVRSKPMEEYVPEEEALDPYRQLFEMFEVLEDSGHVPLVLLSGRPIPKLRKWVDMMSRKAKMVFGVTVLVEESIPDDCLILCGADNSNAELNPESIRFSVKVTLP